jgi:hypothetical protein
VVARCYGRYESGADFDCDWFVECGDGECTKCKEEVVNTLDYILGVHTWRDSD